MFSDKANSAMKLSDNEIRSRQSLKFRLKQTQSISIARDPQGWRKVQKVVGGGEKTRNPKKEKPPFLEFNLEFIRRVEQTSQQQ
ncbi:hypothetical protein NPIL_409161 [Nephila pilipes]|uniref:Uncharacterized protein n=1 Tax=Nephila pilipes TaxID=299642 RepID=A0A8X6UMH7_NEPPI|nr:hypothetical protein NPIL_409161 [Nephila pilipes]